MILNPEPPRVAASMQLSAEGISPWQLCVECLNHVPAPLFEPGRHSNSRGNTKGYFRSPVSRKIIRWFLYRADPNRRYSAAEVKEALFADDPNMTNGAMSRYLAGLSGTSSTILHRISGPKRGKYLTYKYYFNRSYDLDLIPWAK